MENFLAMSGAREFETSTPAPSMNRTANRPGSQQVVWPEDCRLFQTASPFPRAADGDRPRSEGVGSRSQCMRKNEWRLTTNLVVGFTKLLCVRTTVWLDEPGSRSRSRALIGLVAGLLLLSLCSARAAETSKVKPAKLKVSGFGLLGDRELKKTIRLMSGNKTPPEFYDANFVEDAALIILSTLNRDGYLAPRLQATLTLSDGRVQVFEWDKDTDTVLSGPLAVKKVRFRVRRGVLYYYQHLTIHGLKSLSPAEAKGLFVEIGFLVPLKGTRVYTPSRLDRSVADLTEALARKGFEHASVNVAELTRNDSNGAVRVTLSVEEGLKTWVRSATTEVYGTDKQTPIEILQSEPQSPYSRLWLQNFAQGLRTNQYRKGFPDASADVSTLRRETNAPSVLVDLLATVKTGPKIKLGEVRFEGNQRTKRSVLESRIKFEPGEDLDRIEVEHGRNRLARLGAFDSVAVRYNPVDDTTRDVVYEVKESKALDFSLLTGYGSYELLRGGFELDHKNAFGLGHQARLRVTQSFKSSSADFLYTVPEVFREDVDLFFSASGLRREEISFVREEYGGGVGARKFFRPIDTDISARYNYQYLNALDNQAMAAVGVERTRVGAVVLDLRHDRRDNPLLPTRGYDVLANLEVASASLGGEVDYQRFELAGSYHANLVGGLFLHLGVRHGAALQLGGANGELPFTKRFFPGGENSVRGYQQGEASPRDADGNLLGAESYVLGNVELEQFLTPTLSLVGFVDAVGFAEHLRDYPAHEALYSAGGGIRWKSIIGPVRLEYGYNLNRRSGDPHGTLHFSLGFPF
jgi:outer membrane protein insertion porin family